VIEPTATLARPVPAFTPPSDASTPVRLTRADIDTLLAALNTHQTTLCDAWDRATDRAGHAQAAEINRRMAHVDRLAAALRDAAIRL